MSAGLTLATAGRVLRQLRRDRRTVVMLLLLPCLLETLLWWVYRDAGPVFVIPQLLLCGLLLPRCPTSSERSPARSPCPTPWTR
ncbi:MAG: hypothetical protein ABIV05_05255 [Actinomycetota bacterium]